MVKENEIQYIKNGNGLAIKTNKNKIELWKTKINDWLISLDYKLAEKI